MPFIDARFTTTVDSNKEEIIKQKLGKAIGLIGKSEQYLMVQIEGGCNLYFQGNKNSDSAYFEVKLLGKSTKANYEKLTKALCELASEELGIDGSRVYVKFEEVEYWGFDSIIF